MKHLLAVILSFFLTVGVVSANHIPTPSDEEIVMICETDAVQLATVALNARSKGYAAQDLIQEYREFMTLKSMPESFFTYSKRLIMAVYTSVGEDVAIEAWASNCTAEIKSYLKAHEEASRHKTRISM